MAASRFRTDFESQRDLFIVIVQSIHQRLEHLTLAQCKLGQGAMGHPVLIAMLPDDAKQLPHLPRRQQMIAGAQAARRRNDMSATIIRGTPLEQASPHQG